MVTASMKLGDFQSMLQLTVGLNIAYFTFREIRTPVLNRLAEKIVAAEQLIGRTRAMLAAVERPESPGPDEMTSIWIRADNDLRILAMHEENILSFLNPAAENIDKYENFMRKFCVAAAAVGFFCLCYSSIKADSTIERLPLIFAAVTALSLIPTAIAVFYNWSITSIVQDAIDHVCKWTGEVGRLHDTFARDYLVRYKALREQVKISASK